jgi:cell division protein FtsL
MIRRVPSKHRNTLVKRERDPRALTRLALLLLCGLALAIGFVYAGGRHFAALRFGYETEKLRNALNNAREEQRRLLLQREAAASPAKLEIAARRLGMQPMQPAQIDPVKQRADAPEDKPVIDKKPSPKVEAGRKSSQEVRARQTGPAM